MSAIQDKPEPAGAAAPAAGALPAVDAAPPWSEVWQLPLLLLSLGVFIVALVYMVPETTPDDFTGALDEVQAQIEAGQLTEARARLDAISPHTPRASHQERARFKLLNADLLFRGQQIHHTNLDETHQLTKKLYTEARGEGMQLDGLRRQRLAETLAALGEEREALRMLDTLKDEPPARRFLIARRILERRFAAADHSEDTYALLDRFISDVQQAKDREQEIWAVNLRMQRLLDTAGPQAAQTQLVRQIMRLKEAGGEADLAPLQLLLARAYHQQGDFQQAEHLYQLLQQRLPASDAAHGEILVGLAKVRLDQTANYEEARDLLSRAYLDYPGTPAFWDAVLGLAGAETQLRNDAEALRYLGEAVKMLADQPTLKDKRQSQLAQLIRTQHSMHVDKENYAIALEYLRLLEAVYPQALPEGDLLSLADTHEKLARQLTEEGKATHSDSTKAEARREAYNHFGEAGERFMQHARIPQVTIRSPQAARESLWRAAGAFDAANRWDKAIEMYRAYIEAGDPDSRQIEATARLGRALLANHQYDLALEQFRKLDQQHPTSRLTQEILVPMAQTLEKLGELDLARNVLVRMLSDQEQIRPESDLYREALLELGRMHYRYREFSQAITRLDEAVKRYGDEPDASALYFALADAYRQSVPQLEQEAARAATQAEKSRLLAERAQRLETAQELFEKVLSLLKGKPREQMTDVELIHFRNAAFYRADCAFDLGRFEQSIELYDHAASQFADHPASLMAMVQIVNANCELGNLAAARVANQRAREQLKRIPEDAFNDPNLPLTRQHWQDWLRWTEELNLYTPAEGQAKADQPRP